MRIGLLIEDDINTLSGGYLYNRKLVSYLRQQGDLVDIVAIGRMSPNEILHRLAKTNVDVLVQDELVHPSVYRINPKLSGHNGRPVVGLVHLLTSFDQHPFYKAWLYRHRERRYLQSVDGLILNSQTTLKQARSLLNGKLPAYTVAVPSGDNFPGIAIDPARISERTDPTRPLKLLFVGNVIRRKGLHVLVEALHRLAGLDIQLLVAGRLDMEPGYTNTIQQLVRQYQLESRITLAGPVEGDELGKVYQSHHLLVLPSFFEGYGIVYVEAQQFGLPVIGTTAGAAGEIIRHGSNGYLIEPGDDTQLSVFIQQLYQDRELLLRLGRNAQAAFQNYPSWNDSCKLVRKFLLAMHSHTGTIR